MRTGHRHRGLFKRTESGRSSPGYVESGKKSAHNLPKFGEFEGIDAASSAVTDIPLASASREATSAAYIAVRARQFLKLLSEVTSFPQEVRNDGFVQVLRGSAVTELTTLANEVSKAHIDQKGKENKATTTRPHMFDGYYLTVKDGDGIRERCDRLLSKRMQTQHLLTQIVELIDEFKISLKSSPFVKEERYTGWVCEIDKKHGSALVTIPDSEGDAAQEIEALKHQFRVPWNEVYLNMVVTVVLQEDLGGHLHFYVEAGRDKKITEEEKEALRSIEEGLRGFQRNR